MQPSRIPDYGSKRLGALCARCTLDSPNIRTVPVCCSPVQCWAVFACKRCRKRGLFSVTIFGDTLSIYQWNAEHAVVKLYLRQQVDGG